MHKVDDPNDGFTKKIAQYLVVIIVILPFFFVYLKYQDQEIGTQTIKQDSKLDTVIKTNKDNVATINFSDVRAMKISHDEKRLYVYGHDRSGIAIIDIENMDNIKLLSSYLYPDDKNHVNEVDMVETKDGEKLYAVSPKLGLYCFDISDLNLLKLEKIIKIPRGLKISLSEDETKAYIRNDRGMIIVDLSLQIPTVIGEYISSESIAVPQPSGGDYYPIDLGDIATITDTRVLLLDRKGLHLLDVSDPKKIEALDSISLLGRAKEIVVAPNKQRIYIATTSNYIESYDIGNLYNIKPLGGYTTLGNVSNIKIIKNGTKIIVANTKAQSGSSKPKIINTNIDVVDVSYGLDPKLLKQYKTNEYLYALELSADEKSLFTCFPDQNKYAYKSYVSVRKVELQP